MRNRVAGVEALRAPSGYQLESPKDIARDIVPICNFVLVKRSGGSHSLDPSHPIVLSDTIERRRQCFPTGPAPMACWSLPYNDFAAKSSRGFRASQAWYMHLADSQLQPRLA